MIFDRSRSRADLRTARSYRHKQGTVQFNEFHWFYATFKPLSLPLAARKSWREGGLPHQLVMRLADRRGCGNAPGDCRDLRRGRQARIVAEEGVAAGDRGIG